MSTRAKAFLDFRPRCDSLRLESLIRRRSYGRVRDLRLELRREGLILRGLAPSYYVKQLAQQAVLEAGELTLLAMRLK